MSLNRVCGRREAGVNQSGRPIETFDGRGDTFADALEDAAGKAVEKDVANVGKEYVVLHHIVTDPVWRPSGVRRDEFRGAEESVPV